MSELIPPHDDIVWTDLPDGIHQKGVRVSKPDEGHIRAEMFTRIKPGLYSMLDPHPALLETPTLRDFGQDD